MSVPRKVVVEPGSYHLLNAGDVAMMQIAVERLISSAPGVSIAIVTSSPELLARACPTTVATPADKSRPRGSGAVGKLRRFTKAHSGYRRFVERIADADLFVVSGAGYFTDAFESHATAILHEIDVATSAGVPTVLLGQGVGPVDGTRLRERMAKTLPAVRLIGLREGRRGPEILRSVGVEEGRIAVTGDDAIEIAYRSRARDLGTALGVNVRTARYAGLSGRPIDLLRRELRVFTERHTDTELVPVVISRHPEDAEMTDPTGFLESTSQDAHAVPGYRAPEEAIRDIGRCRVVLASSYHAAVFAASQGIPVVCAATSPYYRDKFGGLTHQFGDGVRMIDLADAADGALVDAIEAMWTRADEVRGDLLAAAERQIEASRAAHALLVRS